MATVKKAPQAAKTPATKSPAANPALPKPPVRKRAAKPLAKPAARPAAKPQAQARPAAEAARPAKAKKPKLVRDSFTIPKAEYVVLEELKQRAAKAGTPAKKSEILRAGIKALATMGEAAFLAAVAAVPAIKTGRPAKN